jgi:hypothetical protein
MKGAVLLNPRLWISGALFLNIPAAAANNHALWRAFLYLPTGQIDLGVTDGAPIGVGYVGGNATRSIRLDQNFHDTVAL